MAQKTPQQVLTLGQERRRGGDRRRQAFDYPSSFVAQVLNTRSNEPLTFKPARNTAIEAYAKGCDMQIRRAPAGLSVKNDV